MDAKIQALTDKIYREGVEKGNEEATRIVSEANAQGQAMLREAEAEAKQIVEAAGKQAAELKKNTEAELKLFAAQAIEALKSEIAGLVTGRIVSAAIQPAVADKGFMQKVILEIAREWSKQGALTIQTADIEALTACFESGAKDLLNKGVKIEKVNGKATAFSIAPADGSYKVSFGEEEFVAFFKEFLRPQLVEMLF
jgi:V/A-type H+-transporting ATPase subunit E